MFFDDNFLIFGVNCFESCFVVERYIIKFVSDVVYLESKVFIVDGKIVKFEFVEIFNDMKVLLFLGGEFSNSVKYFLLFGNVIYDDMVNL